MLLKCINGDKKQNPKYHLDYSSPGQSGTGESNPYSKSYYNQFNMLLQSDE